jgi:hypothetical protein
LGYWLIRTQFKNWKNHSRTKGIRFLLLRMQLKILLSENHSITIRQERWSSKLTDWHPLLIIALFDLFIILLFGYLWTLLALQLPPIIFIPLLFIAPILLYLYWNAVTKFYKERKLKKLSALIVAFAMIFIMPTSIYEITKPNWHFEIHTDKSFYTIGENVTLTITITNNAYLTQSLKERSLPLTVEYELRNASADNALVKRGESGFCQGGISVAPGDSLQRSYTWFSLGSYGNYPIYCWVGTSYKGVSFEASANITVTQ